MHISLLAICQIMFRIFFLMHSSNMPAVDHDPPCWLIDKAYHAQLAGADAVRADMKITGMKSDILTCIPILA